MKQFYFSESRAKLLAQKRHKRRMRYIIPSVSIGIGLVWFTDYPIYTQSEIGFGIFFGVSLLSISIMILIIILTSRGKVKNFINTKFIIDEKFITERYYDRIRKIEFHQITKYEELPEGILLKGNKVKIFIPIELDGYTELKKLLKNEVINS